MIKIASLGLTCLLLAAAPVAGSAEPYIPDDDDAILERLPAARDPRVRVLALARARLAEDPANLNRAFSLASAYIALGQSQGDPRYEGYAQAALAPWWDLVEPPVPVLILRAMLEQRRHDFDAALAHLQRVLARQPRHPQALLTKATILGVQGQPDQALESCAELTGAVEVLVEAACTASAYGLAGRAREGYRLLQEGRRRSPGAEPLLQVWAHTILGELAEQLGYVAAAEKHFRDALSLARDPYLLGAYADFLLDQDRPGEVLELLERESRIDPLLLRLALAERRLGVASLDEHLALLRDRFDAARRRGDSVHLREEARFTLHLLDQPGEALELARRNWATQREPADARVLLEAALAASKPAAAQPVLDWLERTGLEHVGIEALVDRLAETS